MKWMRLLAFGLLLFPAQMLSAAVTTGAYDYPIVSPYDATVVGTPSIYRADVPEEVPVKEYNLVVFEDREIPDVFW